ncbi:MAG: type II toxin-antitoxin system ParD family antitoxin [Terricaulis sp.]
MTDLTITLSGEVAEKLRKLVADEHYARPEEAVADALDALNASRDPALDAWLRETITARADAFEADATRGVTPDQVRERLFGQG